jgi:hypothetical protein
MPESFTPFITDPHGLAMNENTTLKNLISNLQSAFLKKELTKEAIENEIKKLKDLGDKEYDGEKFPALAGTENFLDTSSNTPQNLAEALLWKLGKWKVYKTFVRNYTNEDAKVTKDGGVVLSAFAKHLKNKDNPIYDQHAIRALWAICGDFTDDEKKKCKALLFDGKNKWKHTGSGEESIECYMIFAKHINTLAGIEGGAAKGEIDRLLMPLGQIIKKETKSKGNEYKLFCELCGWSSDG